MSFSLVSNYGGRQPDNVQNIKQFTISPNSSSALWFYKTIKNITSIVPGKDFNVIIPKDIIVFGSIQNPSDSKVKENIELLSNDNSVDNLLEINPIKYNYKYDSNKKCHYGVLAQEVELQFPDLLSDVEFENSIVKTVNYIELIPIMLCKMKKMQTEIDELKKIISN